MSYLQTHRIKNKSKDYKRQAEDFGPVSGVKFSDSWRFAARFIKPK
jgi:hypothetical protein